VLPLLRRRPHLRAGEPAATDGLKSDLPVAACCRPIVGVHFDHVATSGKWDWYVARGDRVGLRQCALRGVLERACDFESCSNAETRDHLGAGDGERRDLDSAGLRDDPLRPI
jgi:hypothetical protein